MVGRSLMLILSCSMCKFHLFEMVVVKLLPSLSSLRLYLLCTYSAKNAHYTFIAYLLLDLFSVFWMRMLLSIFLI